MSVEPVTIKAYKYGHRLHYEWPAEIVEKTDEYIMVLCREKRKFIHHTKQKTFIMPYYSIELFFVKEWYTVAISFHDRDRLMYYCNIAMPSQLSDNELSFVDMDIDYLKEPDEDWKIVDRDEFEQHKLAFNYPSDIIDRVELAVEQLQQRVQQRVFPFDGSIDYSFLERCLHDCDRSSSIHI